jgi:rubrerythrin
MAVKVQDRKKGNWFNCMKCGKPRSSKSNRVILKPGKGMGVSMWYNRGKCPVCGSAMMKIRGIAGCRSRRR